MHGRVGEALLRNVPWSLRGCLLGFGLLAATASLAQAPAPSPGPASAGRDRPARVPLPPLVPGGVPMAQIFDSRVPDKGVLRGARVVVWGASRPDLGGPYTSFYHPNDRDPNRGRPPRWYAVNRPDWITYQCDRTRPATGFTYPWGEYAGLDFTREDVRRFVFDTYLAPAIDRGYPAIALDNASGVNWKGVCGVFRDGAWVQQFTGERRDPAYFEALLDYLSWLRREIHGRGAAVMINAAFIPDRVEETRRLVSLADVWLDEAGFANDCRPRTVDNVWRRKVALVAAVAKERGYIQVNKICVPFAEMDDAELNWILGNFLLVRGPRSYVAIQGLNESGFFLERPDLRPDVGAPSGEIEERDGLFLRAYERALVAVNPSSRIARRFELAPGARSLRGEPLPTAVELGPRSGLVALRPAS